MKKIILSAILIAGFMASCQNTNNKTEKENSNADSSVYSFQDCDVTMGGIHFTKMWNDAEHG